MSIERVGLQQREFRQRFVLELRRGRWHGLRLGVDWEVQAVRVLPVQLLLLVDG